MGWFNDDECTGSQRVSEVFCGSMVLYLIVRQRGKEWLLEIGTPGALLGAGHQEESNGLHKTDWLWVL